MARDDLHFRLRIPEALKAQLEESAASNNRSVTAEIVSRLERSFSVVPEWENAIENMNDLWKRVEVLEGMVQDHDERLNPGKHDWR
ncbi:Arc family DNA-binding protein [Gemmobacter sp. LW-1]|uniref:Arc family DNA-binding protein n=1 Tax=Gemmobacter sp. LW-1 TaxID=1529005 RepID=UPI0009E8F411|nr:Arc family DNA-binding protein [Gemmobacter sp. LW-1]